MGWHRPPQGPTRPPPRRAETPPTPTHPPRKQHSGSKRGQGVGRTSQASSQLEIPAGSGQRQSTSKTPKRQRAQEDAGHDLARREGGNLGKKTPNQPPQSPGGIHAAPPVSPGGITEVDGMLPQERGGPAQQWHVEPKANAG